MGRHSQRKANPTNPKPYYGLEEVRQKIDLGAVIIRKNALDTALKDFGWESEDILNAVWKFEEKDFYKSAKSKHDTMITMDFYKATVATEQIYCHFYIADDSEQSILIINSFKQNEDL